MISNAHVVLDVNDLEIEAEFWGAVLGQEPGPVRSNGSYLTVGKLPGGGWLVVQKVPAEKALKNRMHLGLVTSDLVKAIESIKKLGGNLIGDRRPRGGVTMIDPEGNEFCIAAFERSKEGVRTPVEKAQ